jgi:hypothetical protein
MKELEIIKQIGSMSACHLSTGNGVSFFSDKAPLPVK